MYFRLASDDISKKGARRTKTFGISRDELEPTEKIALCRMIHETDAESVVCLSNFFASDEIMSPPTGLVAVLKKNTRFSAHAYKNMFRGFAYAEVDFGRTVLKDSLLEEFKRATNRYLRDASTPESNGALGSFAWAGLYEMTNYAEEEEADTTKYAVCCVAGLPDERAFSEALAEHHDAAHDNAAVFETTFAKYREIAKNNRRYVISRLLEACGVRNGAANEKTYESKAAEWLGNRSGRVPTITPNLLPEIDDDLKGVSYLTEEEKSDFEPTADVTLTDVYELTNDRYVYASGGVLAKTGTIPLLYGPKECVKLYLVSKDEHPLGETYGFLPAQARQEPPEVRREPSEVRREPSEVRREPSEVRREPSEVRREPRRDDEDDHVCFWEDPRTKNNCMLESKFTFEDKTSRYDVLGKRDTILFKPKFVRCSVTDSFGRFGLEQEGRMRAFESERYDGLYDL